MSGDQKRCNIILMLSQEESLGESVSSPGDRPLVQLLPQVGLVNADLETSDQVQLDEYKN